MDKKILQKEIFKYVRFEIPNDWDNTAFDNFNNLFQYIGEHVTNNKSSFEGKAYYEIRKKTDELLGVSNYKIHKLKTSKAEIKSFRKFFSTLKFGEKTKIIRIPYKASYIFQAIIEIVDVIRHQYELPQNLIKLVDMSYGIAFYSEPLRIYDMNYDTIREEYVLCKCSECCFQLKNDFHSLNSPFSKFF